MHAMTPAIPSEQPAPSPWGRALLGRLLAPWLKIKRDPAEPLTLLATGTPVVYVIERQGLSDGLILERACREAGLPSPLRPIPGVPRRRRSMFALSQREGWLVGRDRQRAPREALKQLLLALEAQPERDIQLLPVSIYVGRAPNRQSGWLRALLSENWVVVGRFRRLLAILLNGRDTIVHFSTPISLRSALDEVPG